MSAPPVGDCLLAAWWWYTPRSAERASQFTRPAPEGPVRRGEGREQLSRSPEMQTAPVSQSRKRAPRTKLIPQPVILPDGPEIGNYHHIHCTSVLTPRLSPC